MKKAIILIVLCILGISVKAQTKATASKSIKQIYKKIVVIDSADYIQLIKVVVDYRDNVDYIPSIIDENKTQVRKNIKAYLEGLDKRVKLDSVLIKKQ